MKYLHGRQIIDKYLCSFKDFYETILKTFNHGDQVLTLIKYSPLNANRSKSRDNQHPICSWSAAFTFPEFKKLRKRISGQNN